MYGYVYLTTNKITGKQYIGQRKGSEFDKNYKGSGNYIKAAIEKYGFDNFECHIIDTAESREELNNKEFVYVELYCTMHPNGYNLKEGGGVKNVHVSDETRKRMCIAQKGKPHTKPSEETRRKMSITRKGKLQPWDHVGMRGKHHSEETKQKISHKLKSQPANEHSVNALKQYAAEHGNAFKGKKHSEESRLKLSESHKGQTAWNRKKITQIDTTGNVLNIFESVKAAAQHGYPVAGRAAKEGNLYKGCYWKFV